MTGFSNPNPPINRSVVHTTQMSLSFSHTCKRTYKPQRNKHNCSLFCAAKTKSQSLHGGLFDTPKARTATEASKCVCAIVKFFYSRRQKQKPRGVFFLFLTSSLPVGILGAVKKVRILYKRPVTATLGVYDFQHPGHRAPCMNAPLLYLYLAVYL